MGEKVRRPVGVRVFVEVVLFGLLGRVVAFCGSLGEVVLTTIVAHGDAPCPG